MMATQIEWFLVLKENERRKVISLADGTPDTLRPFVKQNMSALHGTPHRAFRVLRPLYEQVERPSGVLESIQRIDEPNVREQIGKITGKQVTRVVFISSRKPFPRPPWLTDEAYQGACAALESLVDDSIERWFVDCIHLPTIEPHLTAKNQRLVRLFLYQTLGHAEWHEMRDAAQGLIERFRARVIEQSGFSHAVSIFEDAIHFYAAFLMLNDTTAVDTTERLVSLLAQCVPLGKLKDKPDTWVALCA